MFVKFSGQLAEKGTMSDSVKRFFFEKIQGNEMKIAILEQSDERCSGRASWAKSKLVRWFWRVTILVK